MLKKYLAHYLILLLLSVAANYFIAMVFPVLDGSEATFLHTLMWSAILLLIPFVIAHAIAGIYKLAKHKHYKYHWQTVWVLWLILYSIPFISFYVYDISTL